MARACSDRAATKSIRSSTCSDRRMPPRSSAAPPRGCGTCKAGRPSFLTATDFRRRPGAQPLAFFCIPGSSEAAALREHIQMMFGVAKQCVDRGEALESVSDLIFGGDADRAVKLHRLLADEPAGAAYLHLRRCDVTGTLVRIRQIE